MALDTPRIMAALLMGGTKEEGGATTLEFPHIAVILRLDNGHQPPDDNKHRHLSNLASGPRHNESYRMAETAMLLLKHKA